MSSAQISSMHDLRDRSQHCTLRVATKYHTEAARFLREHSITDYDDVATNGAFEASTQMATADCIVDLVSSGVTLRDILLKEVDVGSLLDSSM